MLCYVFLKAAGQGCLLIRTLGVSSRMLAGVQYRKEMKGKSFRCNNFTIKVHMCARSFPLDCCTRRFYFSPLFFFLNDYFLMIFLFSLKKYIDAIATNRI